MGRPKKIDPADQEVLQRVETLAAQGLTRKQISDALGISQSLRCQLQNNEPLFKEAMERGEAKGIATVTNALMQSARGGNVTAQIYYLQNRDSENWKDRRYVDTTFRNAKADPDITEQMTPREAAEAYAETLRRGKPGGGNVVQMKRAK